MSYYKTFRCRIRIALQMVFIFWIVFVMTLSHGYFCNAQPKVDSLKALLVNELSSRRSDILYLLAFELADNDNWQALQYASLALKEAKAIGDSLKMVKAARIKCLVFRRLNLVDSSMLLANEFLPLAQRNGFSKEIRHLLNGLTQVYFYKGLYDRALNINLKILKLNDGLANDSAKAVTFSNIGIIYLQLEDYDRALTFFNRANEILDKSITFPSLLYNISMCYINKRDFALAQDYLAILKARCRVGCVNADPVILYLDGVLSLSRNDLKEAREKLLRSYEYAKGSDFEQFKLESLISLFQIANIDRDRQLIEFLIIEADELLKSNISYASGLIRLYLELYHLYKELGAFEKAFCFQEAYIQLRESINNEKQTVNLMRSESQFLERENIMKLENQAQVLELDQGIIRRQRVINVCTLAILALLGLVVFLLYRSNRIKKGVNINLEEKVKARTKELELNRDLLQRSLDENQGRLVNISKKCNESLLSVKGLCALCLIEDDRGNLTGYVEKIQNSVDQLLSTVAVRK